MPAARVSFPAAHAVNFSPELVYCLIGKRLDLEVEEMNKRRVENNKTHKPKPVAQGKQYPGVHGKVVDWVEHKFEEGILFIDVRFTDKKALSWSLATAIVLQEAHLSNWRKGDFKLLKNFVRTESGGK